MNKMNQQGVTVTHERFKMIPLMGLLAICNMVLLSIFQRGDRPTCVAPPLALRLHGNKTHQVANYDLESSQAACHRIVFGFFTTTKPGDVAKQQARRQLMKFHNINEPLSCGMNLVFVVGNDNIPELPSEDMVVVPMKENMNEGKTYSWLNTASKVFPDADFIFKIDMDTQICTLGLERAIYSALANGQDYFGFLMDHYSCGQWKHCPPKENSTWYYMSGAMYGLSMPLVKSVLGHAEKNQFGYEDLNTGQWVNTVAPDTKPYDLRCLYSKNPTDPCPAHHWQGNKNATIIDDSLCEILLTAKPMPWLARIK